MSPTTQRQRGLVWDWPARVCHWGLALSLTAAFLLAFRCDPRGDLFKYHMPAGLLCLWFAAMRIVLGFAGGDYSRWRLSVPSWERLRRYFIQLSKRQHEPEPAGLTPGSFVYAVLLNLSLVLLLVSGYIQEWAERWHRPLAILSLILVGAHIAGLTWHAIRHRSGTPLAMVHGHADLAGTDAPASSSRPLFGLLLLGMSTAVILLALRYFDLDTCELAIPCVPALSFPIIGRG